jgi:dsRNA-specific ribonuclease
MMTRDRIKVLHIFCQMAKPTALSLELKVTEDGPPHNKTFTVDAMIDGESKAVASAPKKKLAQMQAAEAAIEELKIDVPTLVSEYLATLPAKVSIKLARAKTARMQTN